MWESIPPNRTNTISQTIKQKWSANPIGTTVDMNVVRYSDFEWEVHSRERDNQPSYPAYDHTLKRASGNYLLLRTSSQQRVGDRAILVSDHYDIDQKNNTFCFELYYLMINNILGMPGRFEIYQSESSTKTKKIGEVVGNVTNDWVKYEVTAKPIDSSSIDMWFYLV